MRVTHFARRGRYEQRKCITTCCLRLPVCPSVQQCLDNPHTRHPCSTIVGVQDTETVTQHQVPETVELADTICRALIPLHCLKPLPEQPRCLSHRRLARSGDRELLSAAFR